MAEQTRISKSKSESKRVAELEKVEAAKNAEAEKVKAETDDLLDEIDGLLEENAEEFVKSYVQKGGQAVKVFLNTVKDGFLAAFPKNLLPL